MGCVCDQAQVTKTMIYLKLESQKDWSSGVYNVLETIWIVYEFSPQILYWKHHFLKKFLASSFERY